jgi:CBS domain-containing protein
MKASEIMTRDPACVSADDTIAHAAQLMEQNDCGCIPVVRAADDNSVIGVITDRDIAVRGVARGRSPETQVSELMSSSLFCCDPNASLDDVEQTMSDRQVRRVVIVDDGGRCVGIIAQADLARAAERSEVSDSEVAQVVERISEPSHRSN